MCPAPTAMFETEPGRRAPSVNSSNIRERYFPIRAPIGRQKHAMFIPRNTADAGRRAQHPFPIVRIGAFAGGCRLN